MPGEGCGGVAEGGGWDCEGGVGAAMWGAWGEGAAHICWGPWPGGRAELEQY